MVPPIFIDFEALMLLFKDKNSPFCCYSSTLASWLDHILRERLVQAIRSSFNLQFPT